MTGRRQTYFKVQVRMKERYGFLKLRTRQVWRDYGDPEGSIEQAQDWQKSVEDSLDRENPENWREETPQEVVARKLGAKVHPTPQLPSYSPNTGFSKL